MCSLGEQDTNSKLKYDANQTCVKGYKDITLLSLEDHGDQGCF